MLFRSVFINVNVDMTLKDKPQIVIIISDNGIGIPNAQLKAIFDPFNQGDNSNTRQYGGTGLGLAIVKQLVDLFSGTVEVESFPERGTSFDVRIPLVNALYSPLKDHEAVLINRAEVQSPYVLVVDDNEINQMVVKKVLEIKGFVCDIARNGAEAVKAIQNNNYDCVFMDVQMPVMDGYEATRTIRRLDHKQNVFIVAMTANAMSGDREKCLAAGMDDYISKPLNYDLMVNLVRDRRDV